MDSCVNPFSPSKLWVSKQDQDAKKARIKIAAVMWYMNLHGLTICVAIFGFCALDIFFLSSHEACMIILYSVKLLK